MPFLMIKDLKILDLEMSAEEINYIMTSSGWRMTPLISKCSILSRQTDRQNCLFMSHSHHIYNYTISQTIKKGPVI